eukprot:SAG22_NODE_10357_length_539_cov_1.725000_1_plen_74_part_10
MDLETAVQLAQFKKEHRVLRVSENLNLNLVNILRTAMYSLCYYYWPARCSSSMAVVYMYWPAGRRRPRGAEPPP